MAKFEVLIPHLLQYEAGLDPKHFGKPFEEMFAIAKKTGYSNDPVDPGGATMCGVTLQTFTEYCRRQKIGKPGVAELKAITFNQWREILKMMYWNRWKADQINDQSVANMLVDWTFNSGVHGIKRPQTLLGVAVDGVVGPKTLAAVNGSDPAVLFKAIKNSRIDFINNIVFTSVVNYEKKIGRKATQKELLKYTKMRFKTGWLNRINAVEKIKS